MKPTTGTYVVNDLLIDLPPLRAGESPENVDYATKPTEYLKRYRIRSKDEILTQHITRPHNERDLEIYRRAIILWNREKGRLNYTDLPQEFRTHKNIDSFLDRYKVVAGDLAYSQTIVSHISKDGHYYIHPDIFQLRSLSVREAARLQSFPDNYYFEGSRTSAFAQIGNAVPPLLAESLAKSVGNMLKE
jgi:DNA (cytosine-5)-methyltransferase 1